MSKQPGLGDLLPFAELVIRPGDSRPIVVSLIETEAGIWDSMVSPGPFADMDELITILNVMLSIATATNNLRRSAEWLSQKLTDVNKDTELD